MPVILAFRTNRAVPHVCNQFGLHEELVLKHKRIKKDTKMTNRFMKRSLISLIIRKLQIKKHSKVKPHN